MRVLSLVFGAAALIGWMARPRAKVSPPSLHDAWDRIVDGASLRAMSVDVMPSIDDVLICYVGGTLRAAQVVGLVEHDGMVDRLIVDVPGRGPEVDPASISLDDVVQVLHA